MQRMYELKPLEAPPMMDVVFAPTAPGVARLEYEGMGKIAAPVSTAPWPPRVAPSL